MHRRDPDLHAQLLSKVHPKETFNAMAVAVQVREESPLHHDPEAVLDRLAQIPVALLEGLVQKLKARQAERPGIVRPWTLPPSLQALANGHEGSSDGERWQDSPAPNGRRW